MGSPVARDDSTAVGKTQDLMVTRPANPSNRCLFHAAGFVRRIPNIAFVIAGWQLLTMSVTV